MEFLTNELGWLIYLIKILLAITCGYCIGLERESLGKPAGIKTNVLICLGSCVFTHISMLTSTGDPTRIAAQVVSGVGFIGAGTILHSKHQIEGLTSAALVFVNAAIGMLIGINYFFYSILTTITLLILFWLIRVNKFQTKLKSHRIYIKCSNYKDIQSTLEFIHRLNCKITNKKIEKRTDSMELTITYQTSALANHRILSNISKLSSVQTFSQV